MMKNLSRKEYVQQQERTIILDTPTAGNSTWWFPKIVTSSSHFLNKTLYRRSPASTRNQVDRQLRTRLDM